MSAGTVLIVDDSPSYLQELGATLRGEGCDVVFASSGEQALELLAVEAVDCILLDVQMPGLGGHETCRRIKSSPVVRDIPLILLSAHETHESIVEGLDSGADDCIAKSSDLELLRARVRAQLRRKQFQDEKRRMREELLCKELEASEARAARELAEARATLAEELERKNKELEAFSYSVSHDLRAPLRSVDGFSQALLEDYGDQLAPGAHEHLRRVRAAAKRMGELIDDLLQLARVSRGELCRERVSLSELALDVMEELARTDPERGIALAIAPELYVEADRRLMRVLLDHLLGNAWKFTAKTSAPRIELGARASEGRTVYHVRDNGAGFDMAHAAKLFQPFQRLHSEQDFAGTGIGLATVYRVIDRHGGRVWAEGVVGQGATVFFTLDARRGAVP